MVSNKNNLQSKSGDNAAAEKKPAGWYLIAEGDWLAGQRFEIQDHAVLGRESSCDITIPGTHLSRRHAELAVKGPVLKIRDLGSSNGTFVNSERVIEADLHPGDIVQFDVLAFRVCGPSEPDAVDANATQVRLVTTPTKQQAIPVRQPPHSSNSAPTQKNWKTRPTSTGNRDKTVHITTGQKAANSAWNLLMMLTGMATLAALVYLLTHL